MKKRKWLITALGIGLICGMLLNGCAGNKEESQSSDTKQENMSKPVSEQAEPQSSVEQEQSPQQTDSEQEGLKSFTATTLDGSTISRRRADLALWKCRILQNLQIRFRKMCS